MRRRARSTYMWRASPRDWTDVLIEAAMVVCLVAVIVGLLVAAQAAGRRWDAMGKLRETSRCGPRQDWLAARRQMRALTGLWAR